MNGSAGTKTVQCECGKDCGHEFKVPLRKYETEQQLGNCLLAAECAKRLRLPLKDANGYWGWANTTQLLSMRLL